MLDRYGLLKNLLESVAMTWEDDEDFDFPLYTPPKAAPKVNQPAMVPIPPAEPVVVPAKAAPTAAPIPAVPTPVAQPAKREFPSWFDPSWTPIKKFKIEEQFPTSHWAKLPDEEDPEQPKPVQKPEPESPEVELKPEPEPAMSAEEAQKYLESLPEEPHLADAITALNYADEEIRINYSNKKLISTTLALVTAHLMGLINHADVVFGKNKDKGISAVQILRDHFANEAKKLPVRYQERLESELAKLTIGRKRGPIRELKSKWYGPELVFVNNRAIRLMKVGVTLDEAEQTAQTEWDNLSELVNGLVPEYSDSDKNNLKNIGAQELLAGKDFANAKRSIVNYAEAIKSGSISVESLNVSDKQLDEIFPDIKADPDYELDKLAQPLSEGDIELSALPKDTADKLTQVISEFGRQTIKFAKVKDFLELKVGKGDERTAAAEDALQDIFDVISDLVRQIFVVNPEYIKLAHDQFSDVYLIWKNIEARAADSGVENMSIAESAEAGLHQDLGAPMVTSPDPLFGKKNPRHKRIDESEDEYKARQEHEKELADTSRHRYLSRILARGDALGYLERKKQYRLEQRPKETHAEYIKRIETEEEMDRIRKPEYKKNKWELVKWRKLASMDPNNVPDLRNQLMNLLRSQENRTEELYKRISESSLPQDVLDKMEESLLDARIEKFQHEYDDIKNVEGMNPFVIKALEITITKIPEYFDKAKAKINQEKFSSARMTLEMVSVFSKYAALIS